MKITGELLRSERIKKDLSIQDVAFALKLSSRVIQAIESGDPSELPAKTFVRGFVKSYADYLKLDSSAVLKQFQEEMGSTHPVPKVPPPQIHQSDANPPKKTAKQNALNAPKQSIDAGLSPQLTKKNILVITTVFSLIVLIAVINSLISRYQKELPTQTPAAGTEAVASTSSVAAVDTKPATQTDSQNPPAEGSATAVANSTVPVQSKQQSADPLIANALETSIPDLSKTKDKAPATTGAESKAYPPLESSAGKPIEILLEAKKDTQIQFAKGNSQSFTTVNLKANTYQIIRSASGLHVRAEDGSIVQVTVNGVSKGPLGKNNKPTQVTY